MDEGTARTCAGQPITEGQHLRLKEAFWNLSNLSSGGIDVFPIEMGIR